MRQYFRVAPTGDILRAVSVTIRNMSNAPKPKLETPLGNLLPAYVTRVLAKNGINTVEGVQRVYPHDLLKIKGIALLRLRQIETALYPGKSFVPEHSQSSTHRPPAHQSPTQHVKGSSLNGALSTRTVRALARAGITTVEQLREAGPERLLRIPGFGIQKLQEIESAFFAKKMHKP